MPSRIEVNVKLQSFIDRIIIENSFLQVFPLSHTNILELERPVLDAFWKWTKGINALGGSKLAKAINYAKKQRSYMENYLLDGRCSISNNAAERAVKSYVM